MRILFTICGRAGSKGLRNKNLRKMKGVPRVYYTLASIRMYMDAHPEMDIDIALNTDSRELVDIVRGQRMVPDIKIIDRKPELANDTAAKVGVIRDTYLQCEKEAPYDVVVDLDITSPLRRTEDIEAAVEKLKSDDRIDLVFSVVDSRRSPYFNMVKQDGDYYRKVCPSGFTARQQAPKVYELNASIYAYRPRFLNQVIEKTILDYNCQIVKMPDYLVLDIDSEEDFQRMSYLMDWFIKEDPGIRRLTENAGYFSEKGDLWDDRDGAGEGCHSRRRSAL